MSRQSIAVTKLTCSIAKGAGLGQSYFRRKHLAVFFEPVVQAVPVMSGVSTGSPPGAVKQRPLLQPDSSGRRSPQKQLLQVFGNLCGFLLNT